MGKEGKWFVTAILGGVFLHATWHEAHIQTPLGKTMTITITVVVVIVIIIIIIIHQPPSSMKFVSA